MGSRGVYKSGWDKGASAKVGRTLGSAKLRTPTFKDYNKRAGGSSLETAVSKSMKDVPPQPAPSFGSTGVEDFGVDATPKRP